MKIDTTDQWLPVYEALASNVRLKIIRLLAEKRMNIKELAEALELSSAIVTMHVNKLEHASIIKSERVPSKGGVQKLCSLAMDTLEIQFPNREDMQRKYYQFDLPIGHYTDFQVTSTCGLATREKVIGQFDDPRYFLDPERVDARILWFTQGYIEYKVPNYLLSSQALEEIEISLEIASEAPGVNNNWPSDITFMVNGVTLGQWTSPGDFGDTRGKYTPAWWYDRVNQYGLLKILRVTRGGFYIDGEKISDVTLDQLNSNQKQWSFRIAVLNSAKHIGGVTLFGSGFGNYNQNIVFRSYYTSSQD